MNAAAPDIILQSFIASEDEALVHCKQGDFYLPNHHLIKPLVSSAGQLLSDPSRQRLYFHLLRIGELPIACTEHDFELLHAAYRETVPLMPQGFPMCSLQRTPGLLTFGYDDRGALTGEPPCDLASYRYHAQVWAQCNEHGAIPYIIKQARQFASLAADAALAARILKVLRHIEYVHSDFDPQQEQRYHVTRLWFWALVFIALLATETAAEVVRDFLTPAVKLPRYAEQLKILDRFVTAAGRQDLNQQLHAAAAARSS